MKDESVCNAVGVSMYDAVNRAVDGVVSRDTRVVVDGAVLDAVNNDVWDSIHGAMRSALDGG